MTELLECVQLTQVYRVGDTETIALQGLDLSVAAGEMVGIVGPSGSGKSTLLRVISGLLRPTGGRVRVGDLDLGAATGAELDRYRRGDVGFVWQQSADNLLPHLSALRNVALLLELTGAPDAAARARQLIERVGLADRAGHRPAELSGGEQQRIALAAALATSPRLLLADEPTGALDSEATSDLFALMRRIAEETGLTQVIVSHDRRLGDHVDRVVDLRDGRVATELRRTGPDDVVEEVVLVDRIGRLQLSDEHRRALGDADRLHVEVEDGALTIRPASDVRTPRPEAGGPA